MDSFTVTTTTYPIIITGSKIGKLFIMKNHPKAPSPNRKIASLVYIRPGMELQNDISEVQNITDFYYEMADDKTIIEDLVNKAGYDIAELSYK
jgi:hypothetical protein